MSFAATWLDLEIVILNEISQIEKDISYDSTQVILKNGIYELLYKTEIESQILKTI